LLVIRCPFCRELRYEEELRYGGEANVVRPARPESATDASWTDYLYFRANPCGELRERWCCAAGCGQWFEVVRDTVSHRVIEVVPPGLSYSPDGKE
jgi:sarcosine oxidase subunit delta